MLYGMNHTNEKVTISIGRKGSVDDFYESIKQTAKGGFG